MRLSGWHRIGIVASCLWAPYGAVYGSQLGVDGGLDIIGVRTLMAFYAFVPVIAGWVSVYVAVWTIRWIWRGFR